MHLRTRTWTACTMSSCANIPRRRPWSFPRTY